MDGMDTTGKTQSGKPDTPAENREPEKTDRRKKRKEKKDRPPREPKYGKLPRLFRKTYKEKKFRKRILKFLRLPADREFVDGLFAREEKTTPKGKTLVFRRVPDAAHIPLQDCKRLKKLGKAVKKQRHGRVRLLYIALVFAAFAAILCVIGLFRNRIARAAVTAAMQGIFGAKCDIGRIDLDIFHTRFTIEDLAVADKNEPMKNLFEVGRFDLYFNLLELTRGKLVSENMELTGVTWGTVRETSGALPEKTRDAVQTATPDSAATLRIETFRVIPILLSARSPCWRAIYLPALFFSRSSCKWMFKVFHFVSFRSLAFSRNLPHNY